MVLQSNPPLKLSEVDTEFGGGSTMSANATLAGLDPVPNKLSDFLGLPAAPSSFTSNLTITADTDNYDWRAAIITEGWDGIVDVIATLTINNGVTVGSLNVVNPALNQDVNDDGYPVGSSFVLINNGTAVGKGGAGGGGGVDGGNGTNGQVGGNALRLTETTTVTNTGTLAGAGGGGGGGGSGLTEVPIPMEPPVIVSGGGPGGGGAPYNGAGGTGRSGTDTSGNNGTAANDDTPGNGGAGKTGVGGTTGNGGDGAIRGGTGDNGTVATGYDTNGSGGSGAGPGDWVEGAANIVGGHASVGGTKLGGTS